MREQQAIDVSMRRVRKAGKVVKVICDVLTVAIAMIWIVMVSFSIAGGFLGSSSNPFQVNVGTFLYFSFVLALMAVFIGVLSRIFASVVQGNSPFCRKQVLRLRLLTYLMAAKAFVEALFSVGNSLIVHASGWSFMVIDSGLMGDQGLYIDAGALCLAAVVMCLSLVFEYGTLLQRMADDAV